MGTPLFDLIKFSTDGLQFTIYLLFIKSMLNTHRSVEIKINAIDNKINLLERDIAHISESLNAITVIRIKKEF